jgi:hypothetical protein
MSLLLLMLLSLHCRWKPSQVLPWPRGPRDQVQQLQEPSLVVPTLLSWQNSKGVTPLMLACRAGHAACVAALLDNGADPLLLDKATRRWAPAPCWLLHCTAHRHLW